MQIYNQKALVRVIISDKSIHNWLIFKPAYKKWYRSAPDRFQGLVSSDYYSAEQLRNGEYNGQKLIVENNKVYYRPCVTLNYMGKISSTRYFDTYEEALKFGNDCANEGMAVKMTFN